MPSPPWALAQALLLLAAALGSAAAAPEGQQASDRGPWGTAAGAGAGGLGRPGEAVAGRGLGEIRRLWPKHAAQQQAQPNVTGTFRGDWSRLAWPRQLALGGGPLQRGAGAAVLKLRRVGGGQVRNTAECWVGEGWGLGFSLEWAERTHMQRLATLPCPPARRHPLVFPCLSPMTAGRRIQRGWRDGAA